MCEGTTRVNSKWADGAHEAGAAAGRSDTQRKVSGARGVPLPPVQHASRSLPTAAHA